MHKKIADRQKLAVKIQIQNPVVGTPQKCIERKRKQLKIIGR